MSHVQIVRPSPLTFLTPLNPHFFHGHSLSNFPALHYERCMHNCYAVSANSYQIDSETSRALPTCSLLSGVRMVLSSQDQMDPQTGAPVGSTDPETGPPPHPHTLSDFNISCYFIEGSYSVILKSTSLITAFFCIQFCAQSICFLSHGMSPSPLVHP